MYLSYSFLIIFLILFFGSTLNKSAVRIIVANMTLIRMILPASISNFVIHLDCKGTPIVLKFSPKDLVSRQK